MQGLSGMNRVDTRTEQLLRDFMLKFICQYSQSFRVISASPLCLPSLALFFKFTITIINEAYNKMYLLISNLLCQLFVLNLIAWKMLINFLYHIAIAVVWAVYIHRNVRKGICRN